MSDDEEYGPSAFTPAEWVEAVNNGYFNEDDGDAYWRTSSGDEYLLKDWLAVPEDATMVVFYGK